MGDLPSPWDGPPRPMFSPTQALGQLSIADPASHRLSPALSGGSGGADRPRTFDGTCLLEHSPAAGRDPLELAPPGGCTGPPQLSRRLYPQSSMVARLAEDKDFIDPKDVRTLLPSQLLDSKSLDLAGMLESMEESGDLPPELASAPKTPPMDDPLCARPASGPEPLTHAPVLGHVPRIPRADGSVREVRPGVIGTRSAPSHKALQAHYADHAAHSRSSSEPVYAGEALAAVPVLALVPASRLPAVSAAFPPLGAQLWADCQKRHRRKAARAKPGRKGGDERSSPAEWERGRGGATPETPNSSLGDGSRGGSRGRRKGAKKTGNGNNNNSSSGSGGRQGQAADASPPSLSSVSAKKGPGNGATGGAKVSGTGASTGIKLGSRKSVSKGEVKRLVRYQVWVGRPIRTPWYREKPRGARREGGQDEEEEYGDEDGESGEATDPRTPRTPPPREYPKPPIRPRIITRPGAGAAAGSGQAVGTPMSCAGASPLSPDVKGTGFFCPRGQSAVRK